MTLVFEMVQVLRPAETQAIKIITENKYKKYIYGNANGIVYFMNALRHDDSRPA